jgi:hypothetical protein
MAVFFLVLMPLKYAILSVGGTETIGKITLLSTSCDNGSPIKPKPRVTAVIWVGNMKHEVSGGGGDGISEFCNIKIGDTLKVTYFDVPKVNYIVATIGNPKEIFLTFFGCGIFLNIVGNLLLVLLKWDAGRRLKQHNRISP